MHVIKLFKCGFIHEADWPREVGSAKAFLAGHPEALAVESTTLYGDASGLKFRKDGSPYLPASMISGYISLNNIQKTVAIRVENGALTGYHLFSFDTNQKQDYLTDYLDFILDANQAAGLGRDGRTGSLEETSAYTPCDKCGNYGPPRTSGFSVKAKPRQHGQKTFARIELDPNEVAEWNARKKEKSSKDRSVSSSSARRVRYKMQPDVGYTNSPEDWHTDLPRQNPKLKIQLFSTQDSAYQVPQKFTNRPLSSSIAAKVIAYKD